MRGEATTREKGCGGQSRETTEGSGAATGRIIDSFPQTDFLTTRKIRLGLKSNIFSGGTPDKTKSAYWEDGQFPWIGSGEVNQGHITIPTAYITGEAVLNSATKLFPIGSLAMALAGQGKTKATVATMGIDAYGNQSLACIADYSGYSRFLYWWLRSLYKEIRGLSSQDTRDGLNQSMVGQIPVPDYDYETQKIIADFLDCETTRIDKLTEKKQRLLELAAEKQSALITSAVSDVFNAKARKLRTCGRRGKSMGSFPIKVLFDTCRKSVDPSSFGDGDVFHYSLPIWHEIGDGRIEAANQIESLKLLISGGEILVSKLNPEKGAVVHAKSHTLPVIASIEFIALRPRKIYGRYGYWLMLSAPIRAELSASVESVTNSHKRARVDRFLSLYVDVPDIPNQKAIADLLDCETARIDALRAKTLDSIDRLCEYRSALITAAVTGQIDVATWRKRGQTDRYLDAIEQATPA